MAQLAIIGHPTRGKEVIQLLEMLGANRLGYKDTFVGFYYYIECGAICSSDEYPTYSTIFTLEEFLAKYPFKVGDKVIAYAEGCIASFSIKDMRWNNELNKVEYKICSAWYDASVLSAIQPYTDYDIKTNKEEDMSDLKKCGTATIKYIQENGSRDMELIIPYNQEIVNIDGRYILRDKKPQYPKTYEECCKIVDYHLEGATIIGYEKPLLENLQQLLICRDAYWKIAGEQMGLGKPWEPNWGENDGGYRYCIHNQSNKIVLNNEWLGENYILSFPTTKMRDKFYNNFKDLIESCKELL